jgi:hypothetical protein
MQLIMGSTPTGPSINTNHGSIEKSFQSILNFRIVKHISIAAGVALLVATLATPPGWFIGGVGLSGIISGLFSLAITACFEAKFFSMSDQKSSFEITATIRTIQKFFGKKLYNKIGENRILLGSFPTRNSVSELMNEENVTAFLSLNANWECLPRGFFGPSIHSSCEKKKVFQDDKHKATYQRVEAEDHKL